MNIIRNKKLVLLLSGFLLLLNFSPLAFAEPKQALDIYGKECIQINVIKKSTTDLPSGWSHINVLNKCIGKVQVELCPVKYSEANCVRVSALSGNNHHKWAYGSRYFYSSNADKGRTVPNTIRTSRNNNISIASS